MTKKSWNTPTLTAYGSVEQLTEQVTVSKVPGSGDTITITVAGIGDVATVVGAGDINTVTIGSF
ncbi:MAG: VCBS domain-containing protein [Cyanobacteria bacterium J06621_12]